MSFVSRRVSRPRLVLAAGLLYTLGQMATYAVLAVLLVSSLLWAPGVSLLLQTHLSSFLGPLLILVGMVLLELLRFGNVAVGISAPLQQRVTRWGPWGAGLLGIVFALSFCPVSAAFFFGSLIPLAVQCQSALVLPSLYGLGTGLPVLAFALCLAFGARTAGVVFNSLSAVEWWMRRGTGVVFVLVGVYLSLRSIYGLQI
jgi:hypothetical protein